MMTTGSFAVVAAYISCSVGKTARDSSSLDSVTSTALSNEIALTGGGLEVSVGHDYRSVLSIP